MGNLHPRVAVEIFCAVRDRELERRAHTLEMSVAHHGLSPQVRPQALSESRTAVESRSTEACRISVRGEPHVERPGQTLEPYLGNASVRELGILCSARVKKFLMVQPAELHLQAGQATPVPCLVGLRRRQTYRYTPSLIDHRRLQSRRRTPRRSRASPGVWACPASSPFANGN